MGTSDLGLMLAHRDGADPLGWDQYRLQGVVFGTRLTDMARVRLCAPKYADWLTTCRERYIERKGAFGQMGAFRPHKIWPRACALAWGLDGPPAPGDVYRGFMRPNKLRPRGAPDGITPLQWAVFRQYIWGCPVKVLAHCTGKTVLSRYASTMLRDPTTGRTLGRCAHIQAGETGTCPQCGQAVRMLKRAPPPRNRRVIDHGWGLHDVLAALVACIQALMQELDTICWALNPDYGSIPEGRLSVGWYTRNRMWILGQKAIGAPFAPGPQQRRECAAKERSWPSEVALARWAAKPTKTHNGRARFLWPGSQDFPSAVGASAPWTSSKMEL